MPVAKKKAPRATFIVIALILVLVSGIGYWLYNKHHTKNVTSTSIQTGSTSSSSEGLSTNVSLTTPVTKTEDCGTQGCFEKKFADCKPATLTVGADILTSTVVVYYKIIGQKAGGCRMLFRYTKNPNPTWINKDLTCNWDNKITFNASIEKAFNNPDKYSCEGPLLPIIKD